ncbi:cell-surface hemin receptor [Corynebacterium suranareeae]|uniref:Cell-surface hemin receptor n=1 Tax=Corynebacterium suranareeae TaxID=2506452 RepID=A0A160PM40_9CORY|nr:HtaA domain-containing protein [Corynebacterium suranareeae]BAU94789.1 cell-surface hemin receptor [Corynebacterium suranareeae]
MELAPRTRMRGHKTVAALASLALVIGFGSVPIAQAQTEYRTASGGSLNWGFKQSFRNYIQTGVAKGSISLGDGAQDNGGNFAFSPRENGTTVTSDSEGTVEFNGSVHFLGHQANDQWILDTTMSDIKLVINGSSAQLKVDLVAREFKGTTYEEIGDYIVSDDIVLADVSLSSPADFSQDTIDLTGTTSLTAAGAEAFGGFYDTGETLDPTGGSLTITSTTTAPSSGSGSGSASTSGGSGTADCSSGALGVVTTGTNDGMLGTIQEVNNTFAIWNNLLVNTERMFCNVDTLKERFAPAETASQTTGTTSGTSGTTATTATTTSGTTTAGTAATPSGTTGTSGTAGTANTASAAQAVTNAPSDNSVCTASGSLGVTQAAAQWGVKASFQNYIRGSIAKGSWTLNGVGFDNQQFQFSGNSGAVDAENQSGSINFPGSIHFTGHGGILDMQIANIEISFSGNTGELIADVVSSDMEGNSTNYGRTVVGTLNFSSLNVSATEASGAASVSLSQSGSQAFADFYTPGTQLDPISFSATLGGDASCDTGSGSTGTGPASTSNAATGTTDAAAGEESTTPANQNSQFQIRQAGAESTGLDTTTTFLLILAAFVVAGGSMTRFTVGNPTGK